MGEAKRRGTFDERCAEARADMLRRAIEAREARVKEYSARPPRGKSKSVLAMAAIIAAAGGYRHG